MYETDRNAEFHDQALTDPALADLFTELRAVADRPAPPIGAELSALFAGATPLAAARSRQGKAARAGAIGLVTVGIVAGGLGAAAANDLPRPIQRIVSTVVNSLTQFEIPNRDEQGPVQHQHKTTIEDHGIQPGEHVDQPGHDVARPAGQDVDQTVQNGAGTRGSVQDDQSNRQSDQPSQSVDQPDEGGSGTGAGAGQDQTNQSPGTHGGQQDFQSSDQN